MRGEGVMPQQLRGAGQRGSGPLARGRDGRTRRAWLGAVLGGAALAACAAPGGQGADGSPRPAATGRVLFWLESASEQARQLWTTLQSGFKEAHPGLEL